MKSFIEYTKRSIPIHTGMCSVMLLMFATEWGFNIQTIVLNSIVVICGLIIMKQERREEI